MSTPLAEQLDIVRYIGNESLHVNDEEQELVYVYLDESESGIAELMFSSMNQLVDELIVRPQTTSSWWAKIPQNVRENIERKRAQSTAGGNAE